MPTTRSLSTLDVIAGSHSPAFGPSTFPSADYLSGGNTGDCTQWSALIISRSFNLYAATTGARFYVAWYLEPTETYRFCFAGAQATAEWLKPREIAPCSLAPPTYSTRSTPAVCLASEVSGKTSTAMVALRHWPRRPAELKGPCSPLQVKTGVLSPFECLSSQLVSRVAMASAL